LAGINAAAEDEQAAMEMSRRINADSIRKASKQAAFDRR
jgi:hypothetical protein